MAQGWESKSWYLFRDFYQCRAFDSQGDRCLNEAVATIEVLGAIQSVCAKHKKDYMRTARRNGLSSAHGG